MLNSQGQTILVLLLVMSVALSIGLSIVQKSLVDVSTSSKVEQSSRAFSAAEAGIEKTLASSAPSPNTALPNNSQITLVTDSGLSPATAVSPNRQSFLEVGPISSPLTKDDVAQVWLADPSSSLPSCTGGTYNVCYSPPGDASNPRQLDVYWGNSSTDKAALLLTLVYWDGASYQSKKWYLDHSSASRNPANGFDNFTACNGTSLPGYQCKRTLGDGSGTNNGPLPTGMMLLRARLLYNAAAQPFAVQAVGTCGAACSIPPQSRLITSTGVSGETQRTVQILQINNVVPPFFDYAIFSAGDISK